jgi:hypothetical protein
VRKRGRERNWKATMRFTKRVVNDLNDEIWAE